jgi:hypothetical protein
MHGAVGRTIVCKQVGVMSADLTQAATVAALRDWDTVEAFAA